MFKPELHVNEYDRLHCDINNHGGGGGVACYIRNVLNYNMKSFSLKMKAAVLSKTCRSPNQTNFTEIFDENLSKVDTKLGDLNIKFWQKHCYVF